MAEAAIGRVDQVDFGVAGAVAEFRGGPGDDGEPVAARGGRHLGDVAIAQRGDGADRAGREVEQAKSLVSPGGAENVGVVALAPAPLLFLGRLVDRQQGDGAPSGSGAKAAMPDCPLGHSRRLAAPQRQAMELRLAALGAIGEEKERGAVRRPARRAVLGGAGGELPGRGGAVGCARARSRSLGAPRAARPGRRRRRRIARPGKSGGRWAEAHRRSLPPSG